jgi:penicillin-binding protein 1B
MSVPRNAPPKKSGSDPARFRWRTWLVRGVLLAVGLALGVGVPVFWALDKQVRAQFEQLSWQEPTRVYARPLRLEPGQRLDVATLELELSAAGYGKGGGEVPGNYSLDGNRVRIATRSFTDMDGPQPARKLEVALASGRIASVTDRGTGKPAESARVDPARIATLYGGNVQEERRLVQLKDVPPLMVAGLQAVEDRNFKNHHGIDPWGMVRAAWVNVREGELEQGASTLTQQLVRSLFLTREKRWRRKFNEIAYSVIIEARYDKQRILEAYFNQVYMGQQGSQAIHGVAAAAEFWFGRELGSLRAEEMALMVGMIQGPSIYDPRRRPEAAKARRDLVLGVWEQLEVITPAEAQRARAAPLGVSARPGVASNRNPAFMDLVRRQLARDYPADALRGAGLSVMTTLSPSAQLLSEQAVRTTLASVEKKEGPALQAGMVVTDTDSGEVLAMVGNRATDQPGFNRALEAQRPVGSLLKPMVYLLALAQPGRWSLGTRVDDAPITVTLPNGQSWKPANSDGRSHGRVTLTDALSQSYNQATVRVGMDVGPDRLAELLKVLAGLRAPANPSLILGSVDLSPFAMAQVYQFLASGGEIQPLRAVRGVVDSQGKAINRYDFRAEAAKEGDAIAARLVTIALQDAVARGTGRALLADGLGHLKIAGKTGTSNDSRDSWFAGYTGEHLAVVWVGNDRNEPTGLYGGTGAMRVWSALFTRLPSAPLDVGMAGLEYGWVHPEQFATTEENCEGARRYPFVAGHLPPEHVSCVERSWLDWFRFGGDRDRDGRQSGEEGREE